ncbi:MAG TPA: hypothetical protein VHY91_01995 [Pirellulales bacterium]|jgi:hypothetical protein|nr:hypothetical protein [Pirellulales bacterium]
MKRLITLCLALSLFAPLLVGCEKSAETKTTTTTSSPGGKTTVTDTEKVEQSGHNPPPAK